MNIEIILADITEKCTGMTCFEAPEYVSKKINDCRAIKGIVVIDKENVKFSFNPYFMDGDIFTTNDAHRLIVKHLIPIYVYNNLKTFQKVYSTLA